MDAVPSSCQGLRALQADGPRVVAATIGPDLKGVTVRQFWEFIGQEVCEVILLEGPGEVNWELFERLGVDRGWNVEVCEFLTSELGETLVRRRKVAFAFHGPFEKKEIEEMLARTVTPPSLGTILGPGQARQFEQCDK